MVLEARESIMSLTRNLFIFWLYRIDSPKPRLIWTSELQRTIHTVQNIPGPRAAIRELNEINAGICENLTYEEIQERFPSEFAWRDQDKLKYRYPHGESYLDLLQRVDGVVQALLLNTGSFKRTFKMTSNE